MPDDRVAAALFHVELDGAGRHVGSVRYLLPLSGGQAQQVCPLAGREAFVTALVELLDAISGDADRRDADERDTDAYLEWGPR